MAMKDYEKSKFRFSETFNNSSGKTSGSGFIGVIMGLASTLGFVAGLIGFFFGMEEMQIVLKSSMDFGFIAAALMGVRKMGSAFGKEKAEPKMNDEELRG